MAKRRSLSDAISNDAELSDFVFGGTSNGHFTDGEVKYVPLTKIHRTSLQKRKYFDQKKLEEWAHSEIKQNGIRSPLWVRPLASHPGEFELVAGERRYRAAEIIESIEVPVRIFALNDQQALMASLVENMQRQDLNPLEETEGTLEALSLELNVPTVEAVRVLYQMNNATKGTINQNVLVSDQAKKVEHLFKMLGRLSWKSFVSSRLPILKKPEHILSVLREGKLEYTKAMEIAKVKDESQQMIFLDKAVEQDLSLSEIKQLVGSFNSDHLADSTEHSAIDNRVVEVLKRFKQSKIWEDPKMKNQVENLLNRIEKLIS
jgi:ParB family transcriptional regulator, chromosome partitioning protein